MSTLCDINLITAVSLSEGEWRKQLPEVYALMAVRENCGWHQDEESVFVHTVNVYRELEGLLKFEDEILAGKEEAICDHLGKRYGNMTGEELLKIMVLWHDVAKRETLIIGEDSKTSCPGHEMLSSRLPENHADKFGLEDREAIRVRDMILLHDLPHNVLDVLVHREGIVLSGYAEMMREVLGDMILELMLFALADMRGSDFPKYYPQEYQARVGRWGELMDVFLKFGRDVAVEIGKAG